VDVPFGPLAPDMGDVAPGYMLVADGVQPTIDGYAPFPKLVYSATATALPSDPRGLYPYQTADGTWNIVAGTSTAIYLKASDDTWTAIQGGLTLTPGDDWCFTRFGTKLLMSNSTAGLYVYDVEAGGVVQITAAKAPRWMFVMGGLVFGLDTLDNSANRQNRLIRNSARSDHTNWSSKGADTQPLEDGGALIWGGAVSDNAALILQSGSVKLITLGGPGSALWSIQTISTQWGAVGAKSVVSFGGMVFWWATDGLCMFSLSTGIKRIGAGKIDQWFLNRVDQSDLSLIQGSYDPFRKNVLWRYKLAAGASTVSFGDVIGYNWQFDKFFTLTFTGVPNPLLNYLGYSAQTALTWDAVNASVTWDGLASPTLLEWDNRLLQGGQPIFGALDSANLFAYFSGDPMDATLTTTLLPSGTSELISRVTPIDDCDDGSNGDGLADSILEIGVRDSLGDATTWKPTQPDVGVTGWQKAASGRVAVRARGKYLTFRRKLRFDNWTFAKGLDYLKASQGGPR
jgi:hypothetical protein